MNTYDVLVAHPNAAFEFRHTLVQPNIGAARAAVVAAGYVRSDQLVTIVQRACPSDQFGRPSISITGRIVQDPAARFVPIYQLLAGDGQPSYRAFYADIAGDGFEEVRVADVYSHQAVAAKVAELRGRPGSHVISLEGELAFLWNVVATEPRLVAERP